MYLQYCLRGCELFMSASELTGIIKLSYRQAEGWRFDTAVLCLKYIFSLAACVAFLLISADTDNEKFKTALIACAATAAILMAAARGSLLRKAYLISEGFLRCEGESEPVSPDIPSLISGELAYLSAIWAISAVMLSPAWVCFAYGVKYYSLSSDRILFMLLTAASMLLAAGGLLFSAVIRTNLGCAQYLWIKGHCSNILSALNSSWELTRGSRGDLLRLRLMSAFCGVGISFLCDMNFSRKLLRQKGLPKENGLRAEFVRDRSGELRLELF